MVSGGIDTTFENKTLDINTVMPWAIGPKDALIMKIHGFLLFSWYVAWDTPFSYNGTDCLGQTSKMPWLRFRIFP